MLRSLTTIRESFLLGGGRLSLRGLKLIAFNIAVTWSMVAVIFWRGTLNNQMDMVDIVIEASSVMVHFLMYCMIAMIPLKRWIKRNIIIGLLMTQLGLALDLMDEMVNIGLAAWHLLGDLLYLIGAIFVAFGATNWVVYNYRVSTLDKLTRVHNRRFFEAMLAQYLQRIQRMPEQACLLCLDIDNFKSINDKLGHDAGDDVLRHVANVLRQHSRQSDILCRSGGEEFEVLLPGADIQQAEEIGQRLLNNLGTSLPHGLTTLTASIGITDISPQDTSDTLRKRADSAMYSAKHSGKAQVVTLQAQF